MKNSLNILSNFPIISPYEELIAYETLWAEQGSTTKKISNELTLQKRFPSQVLKDKKGLFDYELEDTVRKFMKSKLGNFSIMLRNDAQYPNRLLDAKYPIELFYYKGDLGILNLPSISIVGTRKVSPDGIKRTTKLTRLLCQSGFAIVSGLARGVDTVALETAISLGQKVIGVIGTPIDEYYPIENKSLQNEIIRNHLLISQVPFFKYHNQPFPQRKVYFPERNITMAALSDATVIVEASETSGTLTQARACLQQGRKLFILNSCFDNPNITWPRKYEAKGAIRIRNIEDILIEVNK